MAAHRKSMSSSDDDIEMLSSAPEQRHRLLAADGDAASTTSASAAMEEEAVGKKKPLPRLVSVLLAAALLLFLALALLPQKSASHKPRAPSAGPPPSLAEVLSKAGHRALGGGISGAVAGVCQVLALMWLRTTMNYQYRHGGGLRAALSLLYAQGGVRRFYQGLPYALLQTPLARFGDTAANTGVLALFAASADALGVAGAPLGVRTACGSFAAALWRIFITPLDTCKTTLQVEGAAAYQLLLRKARAEGPLTLWSGALGNAVANFVGSYPWFLTFNALDELLPKLERGSSPIAHRLLRSALMGCVATGVSDVVSNSVRVVKTTTQTSAAPLTYLEATRHVVAMDGVSGLLTRGLGTRLLANALQSTLFAVIWKLLEAELAAV